MQLAANDHSASDGNDENRLLQFNIPILPGDNYGLTTYKNSLRIIATLLTPENDTISLMCNCILSSVTGKVHYRYLYLYNTR